MGVRFSEKSVGSKGGRRDRKAAISDNKFERIEFLLRHFHASPGRLRLLRQSNRGRKRLHSLNLELIQHHPFIETRTSPHTQPLSSGPPDPNSLPPPSNPSQQSHAQSGPLRQYLCPYLHLVNCLFQYLAMLIVTKKNPQLEITIDLPIGFPINNIISQKNTPIVRFFPLYSIFSRSHSQHSWYNSRKMGFYSGSRHLSVSRLHHLD